jgi:hypothetical protein
MIALLTPVGLAGAAFAMWLLTTSNTASVNFNNHSGRQLRNVVVNVPGRSEKFDLIETPGDAAFAADPRISFYARVSFDAGKQHYDLQGQTHVLPVGDTIVSFDLDQQMRLAVSAKPTFMFR